MNDDWLMHFTQKEGEEAQRLNFLVLHHVAKQCTDCAPRVGPFDVLQADARFLPQLILLENNVTLLAKHRDLIIRVSWAKQLFVSLQCD